MKYLLLLLILLIPLRTNAETLNYQDTLNKAINNSFDLKMSAVDIEIGRAQLKAARSDWYPTLGVQANSEHNQNLAGPNSQIAYAGSTMIIPYTQYRNMVYTTLQYNLLDFGVTGRKVHIAISDLEQKKISYDIQVKELKLKILELYTRILQCNSEIQVKAQVLSVYENMFYNKERLFRAGTSGKISVMDEAVKIARLQGDIEKSKLELTKALQDLSVFTQQKYDPRHLVVKNLEAEDGIVDINYTGIMEAQKRISADASASISEGNRVFRAADNPRKQEFNLTFDAYSSLESQYYDLEIDKKKDELSILKRQLLPAFKLYGGYALFGQNPNSYGASMQNIGQRSFIVGVSTQYTVFDGFKNRANREKTTLEVVRLQLEKQKKLYDLQKEYEKTYQTYETYNNELIIKQRLLSSVRNKTDAFDRLNKNGLSDKNELLAAKAELLMQEFELEKNIIDINSKLEEMKIRAQL
jgi:outer membrane protein TolC